MRLLDSVAQAQGRLLVESPTGKVFDVPSAAGHAAAVRHCPLRYVLDDAVSAFVATFAFTNPERVLQCMDLARAPAERVWIEWNDGARSEALVEAGFSQANRKRQIAGVLVTSDASGRRGEIAPMWLSDDDEPMVASMVMEFDLDEPSFGRDEGGRQENVYCASVAGHDALEAMFGFARFRLRGEWSEYYRSLGLTEAAAQECLRENCECVAADLPFVFAFLLALNARNAVALEPSSLAKLNKHRRLAGKPELLEFTDVRALLGGIQVEHGAGSSWSRREARQHFVSGHLVRRAGQIFWRRSHVRGNPARGVVLGRTVHLRLGSAARL